MVVSLGSDWIVTCLVAVCVGPLAEVPVRVSVTLCLTVDEPAMTPVLLFSVNPLGSVPLVTAQVTPRSLPVWLTVLDVTVVP